MASLRRIASLERETRASSIPCNCPNHLTRHPSLRNLFPACQPELSMKALRKPSPSGHRNRSFPHSIDSPSLHTHTLRSKLPFCCRALSTHSFDELPLFDIPTSDMRGRFARPTDVFTTHPSHGFQRKETLLAAGKQSLDFEKSIVYTELKESMWKFEAPPSFGKPSHFEGSPCGGINTHIHKHIQEAFNPMNLCMDSNRNDAKGRPLSLQMLKRKFSRVSPQASCTIKPPRPAYRRQLNEKYPFQPPGSMPTVFVEAGDSVSSAFASLFFIMKMLQQYTHSLRLRSRPSGDQSSHDLMGRACAEMLDSFLWLFQQVFSCTPRLMLFTMVLLADFTLHSMSMHVAFPVMPSMSMHVAFPVMPSGEPPTLAIFQKSAVAEAAVMDAREINHPEAEEKYNVPIMPSKNRGEFLHGAHNGGGGHVRTRFDAEDPRLPHTKPITDSRVTVNGDDTNGGVTLSSLSSLLHHVHEKSSEHLMDREEIDLDVPTKRMMVAPVRAPALEADNYPCFDRTDLTYQHQISEDPTNPLLLANYAQFLHLVRHDHVRAEELYKAAVSVETEVDGEVMGRFASFLWVAKGDVAEADRAFKAAAMADPSNAFHAGNYAHFLWNSSAGQAEEMPSCISKT